MATRSASALLKYFVFAGLLGALDGCSSDDPAGAGAGTGGAVAGGAPSTGGSVGAATGGAGSGGAPGSGGSGTGGASTTLAKFSFFVTSLEGMRRLAGPNGFGGNLKYGTAHGLTGADKI